jgi:hypothetical protein
VRYTATTRHLRGVAVADRAAVQVKRRKNMAVKKVDLEEASKSFQRAQSQLMRNAVDQKDPLYNLGVAVHTSFASVGTSQVKIAEGLNDILERLERIENAIKGPPGQRRP